MVGVQGISIDIISVSSLLLLFVWMLHLLVLREKNMICCE